MKSVFRLLVALIVVVSVSACGSSSSDSDSNTSTPANSDPAYYGKWIITHSCTARALFSDAGCGAIQDNGWVYTFSEGQVKYEGVTDNCVAVFNTSAVGDNPWTLTRTVVSQNEFCSWTVGDVKQFT
ncbi:hypothetical protein MNBD_NITROSPINAE02-946, partial [hydrothermal vent metagenome]